MKKNPAEYEKLTEEFFNGIREKGCNEKFCHYIWDIEVALSRGYGFNLWTLYKVIYKENSLNCGKLLIA